MDETQPCQQPLDVTNNQAVFNPDEAPMSMASSNELGISCWKLLYN